MPDIPSAPTQPMPEKHRLYERGTARIPSHPIQKLFLATIATFAIFASAVAIFATIAALAGIATATTGFLAAIATFAIFAGAVTIFATIAALAGIAATAAATVRFVFRATCRRTGVLCHCFVSGTTATVRFYHRHRTAGFAVATGESINGSQRNEGQSDHSENNFINLCHDMFLSVKWLNVPSNTLFDGFGPVRNIHQFRKTHSKICRGT